MKVQEKDSNRQAEVHIYEDGRIAALAEYGQYVDPADGAICAYVGVAEDMVLRVGGQCSKTVREATMSIAYDVAIDGVLRKSNVLKAKAVNLRPYQDFKCDKFLCQTDDGVLHTNFCVGPAPKFNTIQGNVETFGTIQFRLWFLRDSGQECALGDSKTYYTEAKARDDEATIVVTYKMIAPDSKLVPKMDFAALTTKDVKRYRKAMDAKRPAKEPWAIFRFHYRSKSTTEAKGMEVTYDLEVKDTKPHILVPESVSELVIGSKPVRPPNYPNNLVVH